jgi:hypothetical protein
MSKVRIALKLQCLGGQFERKALLPMRYKEILQQRATLNGVHRLMFAVLDDAVECYLKYTNCQSRQLRLSFYEVQNWLNAKNGAGLFSYETICEELGLDGKTLRAALRGQLMRAQRIDAVVPKGPQEWHCGDATDHRAGPKQNITAYLAEGPS